MTDFDARLRELIEKLQVRHREITNYRSMLEWRFYQGSASDAYKADFDDSSWTQVVIPFPIDARMGESWLRCVLTVPEEVAGIGVSGSTAKLSSSVLLGGAEIYVNSVKVMRADYWTELRGPKVVLNERVKPGETYVIAFHVFPYYEPVTAPRFNVTYSLVEEVAFEVDAFIHELKFLKDLAGDAVREAVEGFNLEALGRSPAELIKEIKEANQRLSKASRLAEDFRVHLVGHAHIDMNWLWPWKDTVDTIKSTFTTQVNLMEWSPDLHFSQSQAVTYKVAEEGFPELFDAIRRNVKDGRWEITASTWVEGDLNMGGTEAMVRQILYAKRYVKERFGVEPEVCWEPDTFGHPWTYPQLLRKSGLKYYYFMRCGKGYPLFWWEGPDGSRVLAFTSVYNNVVTPGTVVDIARRLHDRYGLKTSMFVYGVGDHGGGPTIEDVESAHLIQGKPALPRVFFSSVQSFFKEVEAQLEGIPIPVVKDELNTIFDGCYTTHGDIKRYNRFCERLLVDAEKLCVMSGVYTKDELHKAWLNTLFNQFHDILCGSGSHEAYVYPSQIAEEAVDVADRATRASMEKITEKIRFTGSGLPIVVFNTLSWNRADVVRARVPKGLIPKKPTVVSADGEKAAAQVSGDEVLFVADVPSMGYRTYYLTDGEVEAEALVKDGNLENDYFKVELAPGSGGIASMYDKVNARFVFKRVMSDATRPEVSNLLQVLYEIPHSMSAWIIGEISRVENLVRDARVELSEKGPVKATVTVTHRFRDSEVAQHVSLYRGMPRLDCHTVIDWREVSNEKIDAPMLKASFTPVLGRAKATFEVPFGYIERPSDGKEVPALRWVDLSDGEYGVSLLNDSKYGFDVQGNTMRITLVRTSYSPDTHPDTGRHEVLYALYPHKGDWKEAQTFRRGYEVNHPLIPFVVTGQSREGSNPDSRSFIQVNPSNVVVSCVKVAEDSGGIVMRLYDATGEGAEATFLLGFKAENACEVDLMERELGPLRMEGGNVNVSLKPLEIKTLKLKRAD